MPTSRGGKSSLHTRINRVRVEAQIILQQGNEVLEETRGSRIQLIKVEEFMDESCLNHPPRHHRFVIKQPRINSAFPGEAFQSTYGKRPSFTQMPALAHVLGHYSNN